MPKETLFSSYDAFYSFLIARVPSARDWGQGNSKTADKLWNEIIKGDCLLEEDKGQLLRITWPVFVTLQYGYGNKLYELFEEKQQFQDGRVRTRTLPGSIGEKGIYREKPERTAHRAIQEELPNLPLSLNGAKLTKLITWQEIEQARSYPGLTTRSLNHLFLLTLKPNQDFPQPFLINEDGDISFFNWRTIASTNNS